ncbi:LacI family DNA-binding transcriptional regulator [Actinokineospora xionganensis]|uniref:LacI family DNA-binding transcriptional regulator n=1 Tax=Actinokineospora xionganensis TaxID=2684470 RepID=A0ABR7L8N1_9PSEU|nr:LacI family DNA-binding transcriptional regulator [Actinokineospora xionganensis]MBC6449054.1 LacI family DNA-binding transcriptional regulator [Actinokineospora xionganensis]
MEDVAKLAGVSISTVSHVVNETRAVAVTTRSRVLEAIESTGYTGNAIARSLVTGGTKSIGVAMSLLANPHLAKLIHAIEAEASAAGYTVLLGDTLDSPDGERSAVRRLQARRVDGMLLTPAPGDTATLEQLARTDVPAVLVDRVSHKIKLDQVGPENIQSTSTLVSHLAAAGHRRIGFISGVEWMTASEERTLGYRLGLGRAGLRWDSNLVAGGGATPEDGVLALRRLLTVPERPTAVITGNGAMTAGAFREARAHGLEVGRDLAIVGHDEVEWAELVHPPITTMAHPVDEIGRTAVRLLLARLDDRDRPPQTVLLPPELMHRGSCGCAS